MLLLRFVRMAEPIALADVLPLSPAAAAAVTVAAASLVL